MPVPPHRRPHSMSHRRPFRRAVLSLIPSRVTLIALILLVVTVPLLAACGGEDATATAPAATSTSAGTDAETPTSPADEPTGTLSPPTPTSTPGATATTPASPTSPAPPTATTAPAATPTTPAATATPTGTLVLSVYFIRDEKIGTAHREVPRTQQVAAAAMSELLQGPTDFEEEVGFSTSIPDGTTLNGITIANRVATVDLSGEFESGGGSFSMAARLAQVVYTLTQFPTVDSVLFELDGEPVEVFGGEGLILDHPVGRANYEELTPQIFVESPAPGDVIDSSEPLHIHGTANTFEAVFQVNIVDAAGLIVYDNFVMATSGTGTRGTFDERLEYTITRPGMGSLIVFEYSARDGSMIHIVEIPLMFE